MDRKKYCQSKYSQAVLAVDANEQKTLVCNSYPYIYHCCKRCARKRHTRYLPQDMVSQFLLHLPAQLLHDVMRRVCREWRLVIRSPNFIYHHLRNSMSGLIIQEQYLPRNGIYVEIRQGNLETFNFDCGIYGLVWCSCNGLVVISGFSDKVLYVINPLTKQRTTISPYSTKVGHYSHYALVFVEASMEYKVVHACGNKYLVPKTQIVVLTIGVDKVWRHIDIKHLLSPTERDFVSLPFVTGGYVHWPCKTFVLTMNVETDIVRRFPLPPLPDIYGRFLPMGGNLSFIYESSNFSWDVWEMDSITGEWAMLCSFDSEPLSDKFKIRFLYDLESINPFCWLVARETLVFSIEHGQIRWIAYNVKTREIQSFNLPGSRTSYHFQAHVNSLVWF